MLKPIKKEVSCSNGQDDGRIKGGYSVDKGNRFKSEMQSNSIKIKPMKKVIITTGDVQNVIGIGDRQARNIIGKIREYYKKEKHQLITVQEFCEYYGVKYDDICSKLL